MQNKFRGVMQSPVTPLKDDFSLDLPTFERLLDFHVRAGAPAISWPPLPTATPERQAYIRAQLEDLGILESEPHGW